MLIECLLLIVGLALVVLGADFLVDGASSIAKKFGVSDFVIGLTIVGMGTSAPELVVSFIGALQGNGDIAIGNVVGSNIFNVFMILGATALILPMDITPMNRKKDIPLNIAITLIFIALGMSRTLFGIGDDVLGRLDGAILLVLFAAYIYMCFRFDTANQTESNENEKVIKPALAAVLIVAGLAGLVFGGRMFVNSATSIAKMLNVSDKLIAITILAGGTSMPELVTCIVAAFKKKGTACPWQHFGLQCVQHSPDSWRLRIDTSALHGRHELCGLGRPAAQFTRDMGKHPYKQKEPAGPG